MRPVSADTGHVPDTGTRGRGVSTVTPPPATSLHGVCGQISTNDKINLLPRATALGHACGVVARRA
eukprot:1280136-Prymnesium_polylepis.1